MFIKLTASQLVGEVAAIVGKVTDLQPVDAVLVRALVLGDRVARYDLARAQGHVVLVTAIATVVNTVAQLVFRYAAVVVALESSRLIARERRCNNNNKFLSYNSL